MAMANMARCFSGRISRDAVDETAHRNGELAVAGRYSSSRKLASDITVEKKVVAVGATGKVQIGKRSGGQQFAVKSVNKRKLSKSGSKLLMNEAGLYLSLDHPNIAKLEQVYESRLEIHFVMEHLKGGELFDKLLKQKRFSESQAANAMRQMLLAVSYLHAHKIAHRDLKPENFVYADADGDRLKMIDFGFACRFEEGEEMSQPCGSISYVAPQVLRKSYTEKCDLWSMGIIAYTLLVGKSPWHPYRSNKKETLRRVSLGDVYYCPERFSRLSPEAQSFVRGLLTVDANKRLSAAEALQHEWLRDVEDLPDTLDESICCSLRSTKAAEPFRKVCLCMAAQNLSAEQTAQLRLQFHAIDKSNRGAIDLEEFRSVFDDEKDADAEQIFANADLNNDGEIGFTSFLVASKAVISEAQLRPVFHRLDADNDGKISVRDLRAVLGPTFEGYSCQELLEEVDAEELGYITWDEFFAYLAEDVDRAVGTRHNSRRTSQKDSALKTAVDSALAHLRALNCFHLRAAEDDDQKGDGAAKWLCKIPLRAASN